MRGPKEEPGGGHERTKRRAGGGQIAGAFGLNMVRNVSVILNRAPRPDPSI